MAAVLSSRNVREAEGKKEGEEEMEQKVPLPFPDFRAKLERGGGK